MDSQDLQNIQEAYLEVYEGRVAWHDPKNPNPSGYTPKEKSEAKRKQLGVDNPDAPSFENGGPGEKEYARHGNLSAAQEKMSKRGQQPKGKLHQFKKNPFWKKTPGQVKRTMFGTDVPEKKKSSYPSSIATRNEEYIDVFDIILEYLVAEGYADTNDNALVIMTNMSEEWKKTILEGPGFPAVKPANSPGESGSMGLKLTPSGYVNKHSGGNVLPSGTVNKIMSGNLMVKNQKTKPNTQTA